MCVYVFQLLTFILIIIYTSDHSSIKIPQPVRVERARGRGRPRKVIDRAWIEQLLSPRRKISLSKAARSLGIHRHTVRNNMRAYGLQREFTPMSDAELDLIVKRYTDIKPQGGIRYLEGLLRSHGIRIQKMRLLHSMRRHNRVGRLLRRRRTIRRRKYHSTRPNALWHCDGHHKLILWRIVIHGFIDGYCRTVRRTMNQ